MEKIGYSKILFMVFLLMWSIQAADKKIPCKYGCTDCFPQGCVPEDINANRDQVKYKQDKGDATVKTFCGKCIEATDCGGGKCENGVCKKYIAALQPRSIWPSFHLLTTEIAFANCTTAYLKHPIIGAGYLFEEAFNKISPVQRKDSSFAYLKIPKFYWHAGGSFAFAGNSQNVFAELGLTYYYPVIFILSSYSLIGEYQRTGPAIWKSSSVNRVGPILSVGFMQNIYIKGGYLWSVDNNGKPAVYFSIAYMRDLLGDLIPDKYKKFLPKEL